MPFDTKYQLGFFFQLFFSLENKPTLRVGSPNGALNTPEHSVKGHSVKQGILVR